MSDELSGNPKRGVEKQTARNFRKEKTKGKILFSVSCASRLGPAHPLKQLSVSSTAEHAHGNWLTCCTSLVYTTQTAHC